MCNCKNELIRNLDKVFQNIEDVVICDYEVFSGRSFSTARITEIGKKKPNIQHILHTYCPFCGQLYEEDKNGPK